MQKINAEVNFYLLRLSMCWKNLINTFAKFRMYFRKKIGETSWKKRSKRHLYSGQMIENKFKKIQLFKKCGNR